MTDLKRPSDYLKKGWTQETLAKNADGSYADPDDSAESYCLLGSIFAAMTDPEDYTVRVKLQTALHDVLIERYDVLSPPRRNGHHLCDERLRHPDTGRSCGQDARSRGSVRSLGCLTKSHPFSSDGESSPTPASPSPSPQSPLKPPPAATNGNKHCYG